MATIKSFTSLEQSRKLAEILPTESADMYYDRGGLPSLIDKYVTHESIKNDKYKHLIPCWSLTALLSVLEHPRCFQGDKPIYWFCGCFGKDKLYHEAEADNPVDACCKIIIELHRQKLL